MSNIFEKNTIFEIGKYLIRKVYWAFRRRFEYLINLITRRRNDTNQSLKRSASAEIDTGNLVRIRTKAEIIDTLNAWNEFKGCAFIDDMWAYCGTTQRVFKKVEHFIDERDYRMKRVKGLVILENVYCQGTRVLGKCDRFCFFFWREEWLEKI